MKKKNANLKIYLGADHRGFKLKEKIKSWLNSWNFDYEDLGASDFAPKDDYTLYAQKVALKVSKERNSRGILLCGSGVGVNIVANKFKGVRAAVGKDYRQVMSGRRDDDMNVLAIASDFTTEKELKKMLDAFLKTEFDQKLRHIKRLNDIKRIEEKI